MRLSTDLRSNDHHQDCGDDGAEEVVVRQHLPHLVRLVVIGTCHRHRLIGQFCPAQLLDFCMDYIKIKFWNFNSVKL